LSGNNYYWDAIQPSSGNAGYGIGHAWSASYYGYSGTILYTTIPFRSNCRSLLMMTAINIEVGFPKRINEMHYATAG
jgi:hypothetical protein